MRTTIRILELMVVVTAVVAATTIGAFTAHVAAAATSPVEATAAQTFCADVNAERAARGLGQLHCTYNGGAQQAVETHTDATAVWTPLVTNPATATIGFMQSPDHRWWIMDPTATVMDVGVSCATVQAPDGWTDHLMYLGANLPDAHGPNGAPPAGYVTQPDSSTPCGASTPPSTQPPATQPPGTQPPASSPPANSTSPSGSTGAGSGSTPSAGGGSPSSQSPSTAAKGSGGGAPVSGSSAGKTSTAHGGAVGNAGVTTTTWWMHERMGLMGGPSPSKSTSASGVRTVEPATTGSGSGPSAWWWLCLPTGAVVVAAVVVARRRVNVPSA